MEKPDQLMILVVGPYRSGTGDDPEKMAANLRAMTEVGLRLFRAGHIPVVGEWFSLPLLAVAGSKVLDDEPFKEIFDPIGHAVALRCDACLRIGGASKGADELVKLAESLGQQVFYRIEDVPGVV